MNDSVGATMVVAPPPPFSIPLFGYEYWREGRHEAVLRFAATCPHKLKDLRVTYRLFFDIDPQHKGLLRLEMGDETRTAIFSPETAQQTFKLARPSPWKQFLDYLAIGVEHIWKGY